MRAAARRACAPNGAATRHASTPFAFPCRRGARRACGSTPDALPGTTTRSTSCSRPGGDLPVLRARERAGARGAASTCGAPWRSATGRASASRSRRTRAGRRRPRRARVVVLNDAAPPGDGRPRLREFVRGGRRACSSSLGDAAAGAWRGEAAALLPGAVRGAGATARRTGAATLAYLDYAHPGVRAVPRRRAAATSRPRASSATGRWSAEGAACSRASTTAASALAEKKVGKGRVLGGRPRSTPSGTTSRCSRCSCPSCTSSSARGRPRGVAAVATPSARRSICSAGAELRGRRRPVVDPAGRAAAAARGAARRSS